MAMTPIEEERAAIIAFLRGVAAENVKLARQAHETGDFKKIVLSLTHRADAHRRAADAIEQGKHLKKQEG